MSTEIKDFISSIDNSLYNKIRQSKSDAECRRYLREHLQKQLLIDVVSCSASDVISKIKHLPESNFSEDGQLKLLRVCGNTLGLYKAVKWIQNRLKDFS